MKILGIRNAPTKVRFAIIEKGSDLSFLNHSSENRLIFPKSAAEPSKRLIWFRNELERIFQANREISAVGLKVNENVQSNYSRLKDTTYLDAIVLLIAEIFNVPVAAYQYNSLPGSSKTISQVMENKFQPSSTHWDSQMADALAAAWKMASTI